MNQARTPIIPPEHRPLLNLLSLYASKADELIESEHDSDLRGRQITRAESIRHARNGLEQDCPEQFLRLATSPWMLPVTRRVARDHEAFTHLEALPAHQAGKICDAFLKALDIESKSYRALTKRGQLTKEGSCSPVIEKIERLKEFKKTLQ